MRKTWYPDVRERVENFIALHPDQGTGENWIRGIGWDQALLFPGETTPHMPIAADLDSPLLRGKYMMLDRVDGHCVWISLAVLALLPHPLPTHIPGGVIMGEGSILCDNAIDLVYDVFPDKILSKEKIVKRMNAAMRELNKVGVVGVHDAGMRKWIVEGVRWMNEEGLLSVRVNAMLECPIRNTFCSGVGDDGVDSVMGKSDNGMLSVLGVKLYADGALGSWGAATLEPYTDKPGISGTLLINETALHKVITQWYSAGYQVSTHCIGDLANHIAIQTYKELLSAEPFSPPNQSRRLRIEHAQIITPEDQLVLQHWGIIPSIQPTHATSDAAYAEARLGKHRLLTRAYRMKSLFDRGLPVVLGSDFPVESHDPRNGIYAAVTRRNPYSEEVLPPFYPEEKITVHQALEGFIKNPAYAMWAEADTGDIAAGKWADWVVVRYAGGGDSGADKSLGSRFWEQEWLEKGGDVRKLEVLETWVAGRKVYDSSRSEEIQAEPMGAMNAMGWIQQVLGGK